MRDVYGRRWVVFENKPLMACLAPISVKLSSDGMTAVSMYNFFHLPLLLLPLLLLLLVLLVLSTVALLPFSEGGLLSHMPDN